MPSDPPPNPPPARQPATAARQAEREARLAAALRSNLHRRKAQARGREAEPLPASPPPSLTDEKA